MNRNIYVWASVGQEINPFKNEIKPFLTYYTYAHKWEYQTSIKNKKKYKIENGFVDAVSCESNIIILQKIGKKISSFSLYLEMDGWVDLIDGWLHSMCSIHLF